MISFCTASERDAGAGISAGAIERANGVVPPRVVAPHSRIIISRVLALKAVDCCVMLLTYVPASHLHSTRDVHRPILRYDFM